MIFKSIVLVLILLLSITQANKLGKVKDVLGIQCPPGTHESLNSTTTCFNFTVTCPHTSVRKGYYAIVNPLINEERLNTVVMLNGGTGNTPFDSGYIDLFINASLRVVQLVFYDLGWNPTFDNVSLQNNFIHSVCRPATLYHYLYRLFEDQLMGFCGLGTSGGATSLGYTLTHFGGDRIFDFVSFSAGPIFSNLTAGCVEPVPPPLEICPQNQHPYVYCTQTNESFVHDISFISTFGECSPFVEALVGEPCVCPGISNQTSVIDYFNDENMLGNHGAKNHFKRTRANSLVCKPPNTNVHSGFAEFWARNTFFDNGYNEFLFTNCSGAENIPHSVFLPTMQSGLQFSADQVIQNCYSE